MRKYAAVAIALGALAAAPAQATGAETVGEAFEPAAGCGGSFTFLQTLSPVGQYEVSADGVITSPKRYGRLRPGKHTVKVRAADPAGNTGKPAKDKFRVAKRRR